MVPCYVDMFYLEIGVAALELLEKLKVDVVYLLTKPAVDFRDSFYTADVQAFMS